MPKTLCCVPLCSNRGGHAWPSDPERSKKWLHAIKRDRWQPRKGVYVCHKHFFPDDYVTETIFGTTPNRRQLKQHAVPSVFNWTRETSEASVKRTVRASHRINRFEHEAMVKEAPVVGAEVELESQTEVPSITQYVQVVNEPPSSVLTQTPADPPMGLDRFQYDNKAIHHFTGLETYGKFMFVLDTLGPHAYNLNYRWRTCQLVSVPNQFFMTLMKRRQHRTNYDICLSFDISKFSVANIIITWINFLYHQWKDLDIWPSRDLVSYYIHSEFKKKFHTTRIILDGMECPIQKPQCPLGQQATFSTYKNKNTAKVVVGASPGGLVTHIPESFGGATSDMQMVERSSLMQKCDRGDSIMVDKGMAVQDLFTPYDITINIPTFLRKGNQFNAKTLIRDRKVASKRVHIERIIGLAKTYQILTQPLSAMEAALATKIISICFMLCNFRTCIVSKKA